MPVGRSSHGWYIDSCSAINHSTSPSDSSWQWPKLPQHPTEPFQDKNPTSPCIFSNNAVSDGTCASRIKGILDVYYAISVAEQLLRGKFPLLHLTHQELFRVFLLTDLVGGEISWYFLVQYPNSFTISRKENKEEGWIKDRRDGLPSRKPLQRIWRPGSLIRKCSITLPYIHVWV